ncbi:MAG: GTPase HflX [Solobacterium sp.]|jgi:GTP-binding protein HflX|nr:GTPase HflX [Solobacterium sp.]MCH4266275.1 GTPase HflX [Solobacterium sp.]
MRNIVLAGINLADEHEFEQNMQECRELCRACGMEIKAEVTQQARTIDPATAFRSGKLEELQRTIEAVQADGIVFYNRLPLAPTAAVSEACGVPVMDRTALILEIFSRRARSRQAKLQVEAARLEYALPRLIHSEEEEETHQRGGAYQNRGGGEMRAAILKKRYQGRIADLKKQLKDLDGHQEEQKLSRSKSHLGKVALVGYTNAGKSSLMNAMIQLGGRTEKTVGTEDMLFATLDTSIRNITWKSRAFLLYDTVGFVSDLPHELIDAFHSTLSAAADADLLVEVIDASDEHWQDKAAVTEATLKQIHADKIPVLRVFNKVDKISSDEHLEGMKTSCLLNQGIEQLIVEIENRLYPSEVTMSCLIPYDKMALVSASRDVLKVSAEQMDEQGTLITLSGPKLYMNPFKQYEVSEKEKN